MPKPTEQKDVYAIILCGGSGSRLWPRSRSKHPKHLLHMNGARTLVQETVERLDLPPESIYCLTEASHAHLLTEQLPDIPEQNIIVEPGRRGTATVTALGLASLKAAGVDDDAVVISLAADHMVDPAGFGSHFNPWITAVRASERIISLGIKPTYPSTGFGYIRFGKRLDKVGELDVFKTEQFVEKPNKTTAEMYVESGQYLWNANIFGGKLGILNREISKHMPEMYEKVAEVVDALQQGDRQRASEVYLALESEAIDYGVWEKSDNLGVIPANFAWADIGSWADLHDMLERDADGNVFEGEYVDIDSQNCFVYSPDQLVATIGLENLVIINTPDAVLICPKDRSQDVKKVVEKLKARGKTDYL